MEGAAGSPAPAKQEGGPVEEEAELGKQASAVAENGGHRLFDNDKHPLLNRLVLKQVFELVVASTGWETLKNIRLVCSTWCDESLSLWRKLAIVKLVPEGRIRMSGAYHVSSGERITGGVTSTELIRALEGPCLQTSKPFEKYKLEGFQIFRSDVSVEGSSLKDFFQSEGPHIKHLTLKNGNFNVQLEGYNSALMNFLVKCVPNLEHLDVQNIFGRGNCAKEYIDEMPGASPFFSPIHSYLLAAPGKVSVAHVNLLSLKCSTFPMFRIENFPNLQHLIRDFGCPYAKRTFTDVIELILIGKDYGPWINSSVKILDLMESPIATENVHRNWIFEGVQFTCLQRLSLCFWTDIAKPREEREVLTTFLEKHSDTLNTLELYRAIDMWRLNFLFRCQMNSLKELRLWGHVTKDLEFLRWTPNLKVLLFDYSALDKSDKMNLALWGPRSTHVELDVVDSALKTGYMMGLVLPELESVHINYKFPLDSLRKLGEWMPNVKILKTILGEGSIHVISEQWPLLEQLAGLHESSVSDADVVGTKGKGLVDLKYLKSFHLNASCGKGLLTNVAAQSGFLENMAELTDLQVCVSPEFSKEMEVRLKERIQNVRIIRNYKRHEDFECCGNQTYLNFVRMKEDLTSEDSDDSDNMYNMYMV